MAVPLSRRPLEDVRVVAVEQYGAGPWATLQLADLGAEVIKVEDPSSGGDIGRYVPPYQDGEDSLFFEALNRGKRSISIDLRTDEGKAVFHDLVRESDAVFANLRGDLPARMGLTYSSLRAVNPKVVCCTLTGFGQTGSRAALPGYDYLMQGMCGWMSVTGDPGGPPTKSGLSLVDFGGGYVAAFALLSGLWQARRDGVGCDCDVSLFETALSLLTYLGTWTATAGYEPQRTPSSAHPSLVPFQNFETADGWIVVACPKEKFWTRLCNVLNVEQLLDDERFKGFAARLEHRADLTEILAARFRSKRTAEWMSWLLDGGVPVAPVQSIGEALADNMLSERDVLFSVEHPRFGTVRHVRSAARVGDDTPAPRLAPTRGEDMVAVLTEICGYDAASITDLERRGAFGPLVGD